MTQFAFNIILVITFMPLISAGLILVADTLLNWEA